MEGKTKKVILNSAHYRRLGNLRWAKDKEKKESALAAKFLPILKKGEDHEKTAVLLAKVALKKK